MNTTSSFEPQAEKEKRTASLISVLTVLGLIVLKLAVGLLTGSLGILAQAMDSVLDLVASVLAFLAVRVAGRPADVDHPYGHGKAENLAALAETLLLLLTCGWIIYEALRRLFYTEVAVESSVWGIAVMVLSIAASLWLSTYLMRVARRTRSQSLEGNALNFRTDVLSSSVVLLGLLLVSLGNLLGAEWAWLAKADAVAALLVAFMVLRVSLQLGWRAVGELMDAAPPGLVERIEAEVGQVPGVQALGSVRVRRSGADTFVDLVIEMDRSASLEEAHQTAVSVERHVAELLDGGDVVVHVDPVPQRSESLVQTVSAIAARLGLRAHDIHAHEVRGHYFVDAHVEVPSDLTLARAHALVSRFESAVVDELPHIRDVNTHIEPRAVPVLPSADEAEMDEDLQHEIKSVAESIPGVCGCREIHARPGPDGYDVVLHCGADPELPIIEAHRLADQVAARLHAQVPAVSDVLVHLEPEGEAS